MFIVYLILLTVAAGYARWRWPAGYDQAITSATVCLVIVIHHVCKFLVFTCHNRQVVQDRVRSVIIGRGDG